MALGADPLAAIVALVDAAAAVGELPLRVLGAAKEPSTWRAWLMSPDRSSLVALGVLVLLVACAGFWRPPDAGEAQEPQAPA